MARQVHTPTVPLGAYGNYTANIADLPFLASDVANKEQVVLTGRELVIARNISGVSDTVTFTSTPDEFGRVKNIVYVVNPNDTSIFGPFLRPGWVQADGNLFFQSTSIEIEFAVLRLPAIR